MGHSAETRAKIAAALRGKPKSSEHIEAVRSAKLNISPETRQRMSESAKARGTSPSQLENLLAFSETKRSPETRQRMSEARLRYLDDKVPRHERILRAKQAKVWRNILSRFVRMGYVKKGSTASELGYTAYQLTVHLESLFEHGMSWSNHGEWEIDHIRPLNTFPAGTPASEANALNNLRPLWQSDHRRRPLDGSDQI
jgi:hypothetical protein